jgi:hypothetical protein
VKEVADNSPAVRQQIEFAVWVAELASVCKRQLNSTYNSDDELVTLNIIPQLDLKEDSNRIDNGELTQLT